MKEAVFAFLIALVVGAAINSFGGTGGVPLLDGAKAGATSQPSGSSTIAPDAGTETVSETTDSTFDSDVLQASGTPVLVDFYSDSCGPCKQMAPVVEQVAADFGEKVRVYKLNVDSNPSVTARFNVNTIPTFIVFKNGERGESFTGLVPRAILVSALDKSMK